MSKKKTTPPSVTSRLNPEQRCAIIVPGLGSFGSRLAPTDVVYHPAPYNYKTIRNPTPWRVLIKFGLPTPPITVGLDIHGDVVLGRDAESPHNPDIDLSNLDAQKLGVSRRHALLRPTRNKLFLIDLESTNGSYVNAIPVGRGMAQTLKHGDTIALAGLSFSIEIVHSPRSGQPQSDKKAVAEEETGEGMPTTLKLGEMTSQADPIPFIGRPKTGEDTLLFPIRKPLQESPPGRDTTSAQKDKEGK